MVIFKSISFVIGNDYANGYFYYDVTLPEAISLVNNGMKYVLTDKGFEWVKVSKNQDVVNNFKMSINVYP